MNVGLNDYKLIGVTVTAAVMSYVAFGELPTQNSEGMHPGLNLKAAQYAFRLPQSSAFLSEPYRILGSGEITINEQVNILSTFANNILADIKAPDPVFTKIVDENFWNLM